MTIKFTQVQPNGEVKEISEDVKIRRAHFSIPPEYFSLGLYISVPVLLAVFVGRYLDSRFGTGSLWTIICIVFGTISMFYNLVKLYLNDGSTHKH